MNYQEYPSTEMLDKASEILEERREDLEYFAYPQVFNTINRPKKGLGGTTVSIFTIHAFTSNRLDAALCCCNVWRKIEDFTGDRRFPEV